VVVSLPLSIQSKKIKNLNSTIFFKGINTVKQVTQRKIKNHEENMIKTKKNMGTKILIGDKGDKTYKRKHKVE